VPPEVSFAASLSSIPAGLCIDVIDEAGTKYEHLKDMICNLHVVKNFEKLMGNGKNELCR